MKLLKDLWAHLKEWSDWKLKDWIKGGYCRISSYSNNWSYLVVDRRSEYLKRKNTPTPFNQGPEMQNYNRMMDLQSQAPSFAKNDPRLDELKDVRRQYNRNDKYKIGERQGMAPLDVQATIF